jgi:hypothetical protein
MNQDEYNEIMKECAIEMKKLDDEINRVNSRMIKALLKLKGFDWVVKFLKDYHECECSGIITITKNITGKLQRDSWGTMSGVYIEQHCELEDSYWGNIYFPVKEGKYLKCPFDC